MSEIRWPSKDFLDSLSGKKIPFRVEFVSSGMRNSDLPPSVAPEIALVGRSNVGKSSLLNFLGGQRQLARVSNTPGRTQTINLFSVEKDTFFLVDLPGYGFAQSPRETRAHWESSMAEFFRARTGLTSVLFLIDIRREIQEEDRDLCLWLQRQGLSVLAVQTKADKVNKSQLPLLRQKHERELGVAPGMIVTTSAEKKMGMENLATGIAGLLAGAME